MSVPIDSSAMRFQLDGITTAFPLAQLVYLAPTDLIVHACAADYTNPQAWDLGSHYKLTGDGSVADGTLTLLAGADVADLDGQVLVVQRVTDARQQAVFREGDGFPAKLAEGAFDRRALLAMEVRDAVGYALRAPSREPNYFRALPPAVARANTIFTFGDGGDWFLYDFDAFVAYIVAQVIALLGDIDGVVITKPANNVQIKAENYVAQPGDGYIEMECPAGGSRTIVIDPAWADLNETIQCRKKTDAGTLYISDGTNPKVMTINTIDIVAVRRTGTALVK